MEGFGEQSSPYSLQSGSCSTPRIFNCLPMILRCLTHGSSTIGLQSISDNGMPSQTIQQRGYHMTHGRAGLRIQNRQ